MPSESILRRRLDRLGYRLVKSRVRDPERLEHGGYMIVDHQTNGVVLGTGAFNYSATLEDVEAFAASA